jgi:hypothetical protein
LDKRGLLATDNQTSFSFRFKQQAVHDINLFVVIEVNDPVRSL